MSRTYRETGLSWASKIPGNWRTIPNKYIFSKTKNVVGKYNKEPILSLTINGVKVRNEEEFKGKKAISYDDYQICYPGNLLMCLFDIDVTPRCVGLIEGCGLTTSAYTQFEVADGNDAKYYYYYYLSLDYTKTLLHLSRNIRSSLTADDFGRIYTIQPPLPEQHAIVRYLDSKCAAIDEAIERHKKIIEKLEEYRTCKISHITVNGLNPDAATKDSGIEWAGQIPATWKVSPLKSLFTFGKGLSITKADLVEKGVPVLSYGQIHSKRNLKTEISEDLIRFVPLDMAVRHTDSLAAINGFIFADTSEDMAGCGNCNYVNRPGVYGGYHTVVLKPNTSDDNKYLAYLFQTDAWRYQIRKELTEVKVFSVSQKVLKSTQVLLPPQQEQRAIVSYLDALCENISSRISMHANIIEKLEEYRKSVIYHAVTGKIDCREE